MISWDLALIGTRIQRVDQFSQQRINDEIRETGLTRMATAQVDEASGLSIGNMTARLDVSSAMTGQPVDRMAPDSQPERLRLPNDRRFALVTHDK